MGAGYGTWIIGQHSPRLRFWYRKRKESMVANSRLIRWPLYYIRRKHPNIYNLRYAMATAL